MTDAKDLAEIIEAELDVSKSGALIVADAIQALIREEIAAARKQGRWTPAALRAVQAMIEDPIEWTDEPAEPPAGGQPVLPGVPLNWRDTEPQPSAEAEGVGRCPHGEYVDCKTCDDLHSADPMLEIVRARKPQPPTPPSPEPDLIGWEKAPSGAESIAGRFTIYHAKNFWVVRKDGEYFCSSDLEDVARQIATSLNATATAEGGRLDSERLAHLLQFAHEIVLKIPGGIQCVDSRADIDESMRLHAVRAAEGKS